MWNPEKAKTNQQKHRVEFADAAVALEDEYALTISVIENGEQRFKTLALGSDGQLLLIVYAEDDEHTIAIISAHRASASQKLQYYGNDYNG